MKKQTVIIDVSSVPRPSLDGSFSVELDPAIFSYEKGLPKEIRSKIKYFIWDILVSVPEEDSWRYTLSLSYSHEDEVYEEEDNFVILEEEGGLYLDGNMFIQGIDIQLANIDLKCLLSSDGTEYLWAIIAYALRSLIMHVKFEIDIDSKTLVVRIEFRGSVEDRVFEIDIQEFLNF